ncbi:hypothetical protein F66182_2211 [Fusarium sp. NRRL 66182]|nr:hypothetical protein F66182_2211 [Fusarium sp. NRRL 66182]
MAHQPTQQHKMRLRSSGCLRWSYLPPEIRCLILNTVVDQRYPRWSALASVSKEWQSIIGARNMARLKLGSSCLDDFERVLVRQRHLVRHIYLSVELSGYKCSLCKKGHAVALTLNDDHSLSLAIRRVFTILSTWKTAGPLTLELNATSASDSEHWFKNFRLDDPHDHDTHHRDPAVLWHDPEHGWENGLRVSPPPFSAMQRLFGPITIECHPGALPCVNAVTCLMIRRQFRHCLVPSHLALLLSRLRRLTDIIYEPWLLAYTNPRIWGYFESATSRRPGVIGMPLPKTLKRLILFRDSNHYLTQSLDRDSDYKFYVNDPRSRPLDDTLSNSRNLAQTSLRLEELAVSFLIDAGDFFNACEKEWTWNHLQSLALTSNLLLKDGRLQQKGINSLLVTTAKHLLRMPKLTTMVLWSGAAGKASAFIYTRTRRYAHITWRGTWDLEVSLQVVEAWKDVAKRHALDLGVRHEHIQETIRSHGDALLHLDLPCQVIEPVSLWQIRTEEDIPTNAMTIP